ncbi:MAG TPA: superoxide dismutase [Cu-Zn] SodC [Burkholderiaceae bacterium]
MKLQPILCAAALCFSGAAMAADLTIPMHLVDAKGVSKPVGEVTVTKSKYGLVFTPALKGLTPGEHGFHVHENASCEPKLKDGKMEAAGAAGGHYDPTKSGVHGSAWGTGHRGDLPPLYADASGNASQPVLAPRLRINELKGKALMLHAGGDNHSDSPQEAGGGGDRVVCGVIG